MSSSDPKYQAGETYADPRKDDSSLLDPTKIAETLWTFNSVRSQVTLPELIDVLTTLLKPNEPLDDKKGTTEVLISILCALPSGSDLRTQLTNKLIDTLWGNLQHPPLSYVGGDVNYEVVTPGDKTDKHAPSKNSIEFKAPDSDILLREHVPASPNGLYQYRMPDGSFNNILQPNLGRAGTPYARSVRPTKRLHGVKPDPGLLFDLLFARDEDKFQENAAGISSMLFYHAAIIIHDIFRTSRTDMNISDVSSYLDLAPLYGSSLQDQLEIRTMKEGKLKPDTFSEKRLLGQPGGVNVMLVLYNRFHNYVADILLKINENGRFTLSCAPDASPEDRAKAVAKQDHDLFNVARLVTGGLYVNISLHDYLRAITNTHHSKSDWTLDPRVEIGKQFDSDGVPRGVGNQVSVEFNLLYRFHSCISKRDESWINDFFLQLFPGREVSELSAVSWDELGMALLNFEKNTPKDPSVRTFDGLVRQADGRFKDEDLVRILKESMDDPAGRFGARMVPKALKIVEVLGINQARKWQVASLNEFREFFGLKRYTKFSEISSDANIAKILENLYTDPDMVELYPGLMCEDIKPVRNPGSGICPTYSVGRAVLSDAVTLVRSDRFNTIDFTVANLTNWGYNEVQQDYKTLGGSMLYKLIQRGVPGWFPFNSVAVMQPMYTKKANAAIATELGTIDQFTLDDPQPPRKANVVSSSAGIRQVLSNPKQFVVPWLKPLNLIFPGKKDLGWFMLAGDDPRNVAHRASWVKALGKVPNLTKALADMVATVGKSLIQKQTFTLQPGMDQIDIIRDVAIPLNAQLLSDMFYFDMKTDENPNGTLNATDFFTNMLNVRIWGVNDNDPAQSWNRRRRAQEGVKVIIDSTRPLVNEVLASRGLGLGVISTISSVIGRKASLKSGSLRSCGYKIVEELLNQGGTPEHVTDDLWLTAFGGIGVPVTVFYEILSFFLRPENETIWGQVQNAVKQGDDATVHAYVAEAQRLTNTQRTMRVATAAAELDGQQVQPGNLVVLQLGAAGRYAPDVGPTASVFDATRKVDSVSAFSYGQHECLARDVAFAFVVAMIKLVADLKDLHPAPGAMGQVKSIPWSDGSTAYLNDSWSYLSFDVSTWKLHYNGHGVGNFEGERTPTKLTDLSQYYGILQAAKDKIDAHDQFERELKSLP